MQERDSSQTGVRARLVLLGVAAVLLAPIAVYIYTFGFQITNDHGRWGEMSSALSGIYSPILSLLTLLVLLVQVRLQESMNAHTFDQKLRSRSAR